MNSKKARALRKLLNIGPANERILQLKDNGLKRFGIISHTGNHRIEDKTTYSYTHGPKMRLYKDLKKAYKNKDAETTSAILQYYFENREKIEEVEKNIQNRMESELSEQLAANIETISKLPEDHKERLEAQFKQGLKKYYQGEVTDLSAKQLEQLITLTDLNKEEVNE